MHKLRNRCAHHDSLLGVDVASLHDDLLHVAWLLEPQLAEYIREHSKVREMLDSPP